ncbi:MAG: hypothetical protein J6U28_00840 [Bacteroidales bacterium]|nr:hypothetical protein [Bacteroidales bacterium]
MERNKFSKELIHSQLENNELCHMTPEEKKAYNAEYYKRNKEKFWGVTGNRPVGRQKYVTEGNGQGVERRGLGLNDYFHRERTGSQTPPRKDLRRYGGSEDYGFYDNDVYNHGTLPENHPNRKYQKEYESAKDQARNAFKEAERYRVLYGDYSREVNRLNKEYSNEKDKMKKNLIWRQMEQYMDKRDQADKDRTKAYEEYTKSVRAMQKARDNYKRTEEQLKATSQQHDSRPGSAMTSQVNSEAFSNAYAKAEKKQKVKKAAKQAASDWKSGAKAVSQLASDGVSKGKSIASAILSKFRK